jgi:hypothetical protein
MTNTTTTTETTAFEVGNTYSARSACDSNCVYEWTVTKRTAKFITVETKYGDLARVGVKVSNGCEQALPFGDYSMSPVIFADRRYER